MFGIGVSELVLIAIVALLVVGPKRMPDALRAIGRAIGGFRRASQALREEVGFDDVVHDVTKPLREGMAGIETDVREAGETAPKARTLVAEDPSREYPEGGPDDYGALPETAMVYADPDAASVRAPAKPTAAPGGAMARGTGGGSSQS